VNRALRAATIGCLLIAPVALSSCSAGQIPQTSTQNRDKVGAMGTLGAIDLREVKLPFPTGGSYSQGGDAELTGAIVNGGTEADVLVAVKGDDFTGVRVSGTGASPLTTSSALTSVPGTPVGTVGTSGNAAPTTSGSSSSTSSRSASGSSASGTQAGPTTAATGIAGATGTPTATATSSPVSGAGVSLAVPPDTTLFLGQNSPHLFLTGLNRSLTAGQVVRITFTFQRAGSVTLDASVAGPTSYVPNTSTYDFEVPTKASEPGVNAGGGGVDAGGGNG
jgi:hypothetical protein